MKKKDLPSPNLDITNKLKILYGIATGMAYLHSHKIVHCNLNTNSILLDDDYNPIITNFNYATLLGQNAVETPEKSFYTAPEVLQNNQYTRESDVYSFSLIMYQLLTDKIPTDKLPNDEEETKSNTHNIFQTDFSSVQLEKPYQDLIEKCCSKDPNNRPSFDQISYVLKSSKDLITKDVNEESFHEYIEMIKSSKIEFYEQIIQIDLNEIDKHISLDLKQQFTNDKCKIKYFIIQAAKKLIYDFTLYYNIHQNLNVKFDLNKIDEVLIQKYKELSVANNDDPETIELSNTIKEIIDKKYNMIKENYSLSLNSMVIQQIISILRKNGDNLNKIQKKINKLFCDHYQNEYLFNHDKLREICTTKTKIIDIEKTLQAINLTFKTSQLLKSYEEPKFVSLYPVIKSKYPENLSSVLTGNCFIVTLFGNAKCTKKVLSSLNVKKYFEKYQNDNGISIFGPVNFESFAINEPNSFSYLKDFNEDFPNIFFIEISSHISGTDFEDCCSFLSYISHFVVFCSESADNNSEIENFQKIIQTSYFDLFINCSTKLPINLTENMKFEAEFDIKKLDTNCFRNYLIKEIIQNRLKFIPSEAIIELSKLILEKQIKMIFKEDKEKLKHQIMEKYSNQIRVKSYKFFKQLTQTVDQSSINLNEILSNLLDKTQEFFYVNIYTDFWSNAQIDRASKITRLECKNDFDSLIPVNEYSNQRDDKTKDINELIKDDFYIFIKENPLLSDEEYGKFVYDYYFQNLEKCKSIYLPYLARDIRTTLKKHLPINIRISINHDSFEKAKVSISNQ